MKYNFLFIAIAYGLLIGAFILNGEVLMASIFSAIAATFTESKKLPARYVKGSFLLLAVIFMVWGIYYDVVA